VNRIASSRFTALALVLTGACLAACEHRISPGDSIEDALAALQPGDVLCVGAGVYEEQWLISGLRGTQDDPITIRGMHGSVIRPRTGRDGIIFWGGGGSEHVIIDNLTIENAQRAGIIVNGSRHVTVRGCKISNNRVWGIQTVLSDFVTVEQCDISGSREQHGVYFSTTDHPVVRECRIHGNNACGIHMNGDVSEGGDGMITGGVIEGNEISGNGSGGGAAVNMDGVERTLVRDNRIYDNLAGGIAVFHQNGLRTGAGNEIRDNDVRFAPGKGRYALSMTGGAVDTVSVGNVFVSGRSTVVQTDDRSLSGLHSDRNVYYGYGSVPIVTIGSERLSFEQWQMRTGQDRHSRVRRPSLLD